LISLFTGKEQASRTLFYEHEGHRAVHEGNWKLVAMRDQPWELYDMERDRTELNNLAAQHPDTVSRLAAQWNQWAETNHVTPLPDDYGVGYLKADK
jgi:arylsulfatase A-like enzyme